MPHRRITAARAASLALAVIAAVLMIPGSGPSAGREPRPLALPPAVTAQSGTREVAYTGCGGVDAPVVNAAYEQEVIDRVNSVRAANGLPPLKHVSLLDDAARYHAADMLQDGYFDHDSYDRVDGNLVWVCAWSARVASYYSGWSSLAENIAAGYGTPAAVMDAWLNSEGHRANILSTVIWEIGAGYYAGGSWGSYWVQDFGRRWGIYPLVIDADAAAADSQDVDLYIYGDWQEMRLRNDDGEWTDWLPFQAAVAWTLAPGAGVHTVWAELRDGTVTATSSDSIYLEAATPVLADLPDALAFSYNRWNGQLEPAAYELVLENLAGDEPLTWTLAQTGSWFIASPATGTTPASLWIEPLGPEALAALAVGTYPGSITVTIAEPSLTEGSPQTVELVLGVVDRAMVRAYLPAVVR